MAEQLDPAEQPTQTVRRMRIQRGRVMHVVEPSGADWLRSKCRRKHPLKGVSGTLPRAEAPAEDWTDERLWYPDCPHCPADVERVVPAPRGSGRIVPCGSDQNHRGHEHTLPDRPGVALWCQGDGRLPWRV